MGGGVRQFGQTVLIAFFNHLLEINHHFPYISFSEFLFLKKFKGELSEF